jgi:hypothetical protein
MAYFKVLGNYTYLHKLHLQVYKLKQLTSLLLTPLFFLVGAVVAQSLV